jgi:hypothetical protein
MFPPNLPTAVVQYRGLFPAASTVIEADTFRFQVSQASVRLLASIIPNPDPGRICERESRFPLVATPF